MTVIILGGGGLQSLLVCRKCTDSPVDSAVNFFKESFRYQDGGSKFLRNILEFSLHGIKYHDTGCLFISEQIKSAL